MPDTDNWLTVVIAVLAAAGGAVIGWRTTNRAPSGARVSAAAAVAALSTWLSVPFAQYLVGLISRDSNSWILVLIDRWQFLAPAIGALGGLIILGLAAWPRSRRGVATLTVRSRQDHIPRWLAVATITSLVASMVLLVGTGLSSSTLRPDSGYLQLADTHAWLLVEGAPPVSWPGWRFGILALPLLAVIGLAAWWVVVRAASAPDTGTGTAHENKRSIIVRTALALVLAAAFGTMSRAFEIAGYGLSGWSAVAGAPGVNAFGPGPAIGEILVGFSIALGAVWSLALAFALASGIRARGGRA